MSSSATILELVKKNKVLEEENKRSAKPRKQLAKAKNASG